MLNAFQHCVVTSYACLIDTLFSWYIITYVFCTVVPIFANLDTAKPCNPDIYIYPILLKATI